MSNADDIGDMKSASPMPGPATSIGNDLNCLEIAIGGKAVKVPARQIHDRTVIVTGTWLKIAAVRDAELVEGAVVPEPAAFVAAIKESGLAVDIFVFPQNLPAVTPQHNYRTEWDNAAVVPITNFDDWWEKRVEYDVRKAVKRAKKAGLVVQPVNYDDDFVRGIVEIYNDTPVRQGKAFWHYQKDFETVKRENGTYPERSEFIGAFFKGELVGFIKMVYVGKIARTLQVISKRSHFDKKPTNALLAKAVEICIAKGCSHLVYGNYIYNDPASSLTEFKRRNGFEKLLSPKYYVPLTLKGQVALAMNLHHGVGGVIPTCVLRWLLTMRARLYNTLARHKTTVKKVAAPKPS